MERISMRYKFIVIFIYLCLLYIIDTRAQVTKGIQFDFSAVPESAKLFGEGIVSTGMYERDMAISPDGKEMFYTIVGPLNAFSAIIYLQKDEKNNWSKPEVASFSGEYSDMEPAFTKDGKKLFFVSNRPVTGDSVNDFDIWYVEKMNGQWVHPVNIGMPVNTHANEFYPSVAILPRLMIKVKARKIFILRNGRMENMRSPYRWILLLIHLSMSSMLLFLRMNNLLFLLLSDEKMIKEEVICISVKKMPLVNGNPREIFR
jgi:hypothetical protein